MNRLQTLLVAILLPLLLAACQTAQPTAYGPVTAKSDYGYSETRLDDDTWRVQVAGNSKTSRELVENQLLYRAAEIAVSQGAEGFVLLDRDVERDQEVYAQAPVGYDPFYAYPYGPWWGGHAFYGHRSAFWPGFYGPGYGFGGWSAGVGRTWGPGYSTRTVERYTAYAEIRLFSGEPPAGIAGPAFRADELLQNLESRVNKVRPKQN